MHAINKSIFYMMSMPEPQRYFSSQLIMEIVKLNHRDTEVNKRLVLKLNEAKS